MAAAGDGAAAFGAGDLPRATVGNGALRAAEDEREREVPAPEEAAAGAPERVVRRFFIAAELLARPSTDLRSFLVTTAV